MGRCQAIDMIWAATTMSDDSNDDNNGGSGRGVRGIKERGDWRTSTSSSGSLTLALGDSNTSKGAVTINGSEPFEDGKLPSNGED